MSTNNPFDSPWQDPSEAGGNDPVNPYAAGGQNDQEMSGEIYLPPGTTRGLVGQIPVVGILMIVQGALEGIIGLLLILVGAFFPQLLEAQARANPAFQNPNNQAGPDLETFMLIFYGGLGLFVLIVALLHMIGGYNVYKCRGRVLAFVSLGMGLVTLLTCYCFPTALAIGIYGLIVLLDDSVQKAFELGSLGHSTDQIQRAFARL